MKTSRFLGLNLFTIVWLVLCVVVGTNTFNIERPWDILIIFVMLSILCYLIFKILVFKDYSIQLDNQCVDVYEYQDKTYMMNRTQKIQLICIVSILLSTCMGFYQEMYDTSLDLHYPIDFWTISHFLCGIFLYIMLLLVLKYEKRAMVITFVLLAGYEALEFFVLPLLGIASELYQEMIYNIISDIVIGWIGTVLAYYWVKRLRKCTDEDGCIIGEEEFDGNECIPKALTL